MKEYATKRLHDDIRKTKWAKKNLKNKLFNRLRF
jgi:hypothetical protein